LLERRVTAARSPPFPPLFYSGPNHDGDFVPHARRNLRHVARCFKSLRAHSDASKLPFEQRLCFRSRQATHALREEVSYVVDVLHELRNFKREMFVVVHLWRTTLVLLPTSDDPSYGDAFRVVGLMLGPQRGNNRRQVITPHAGPKFIDLPVERERPFVSRHRDFRRGRRCRFCLSRHALQGTASGVVWT